MPIKKRRPIKHLNKNQARLNRREGEERQAQSAGTIASRFPTISRLDIQMDFVSPQGHVLDSEMRSFDVNDRLNLTADCPGRCGNGRMEMESMVGQMVNNHQSTRDTKGMCREILVAGSAETCNCELRCKINIEYQPAS